MKTAHQIISDFKKKHNIDTNDFNEWVRDAEIPEEELNIHDSRYLHHLETYVQEREDQNHPNDNNDAKFSQITEITRQNFSEAVALLPLTKWKFAGDSESVLSPLKDLWHTCYVRIGTRYFSGYSNPEQETDNDRLNRFKKALAENTIVSPAIPAKTLIKMTGDFGLPSVQDTEIDLGYYMTTRNIGHDEIADLKKRSSSAEPEKIAGIHTILRFMLKSGMIAPLPVRKIQIVPGSKDGLNITTL